MKKFQFKLQAVLTLRQRAEQAALETYSRALLNRQAAMAKLAQVENELAQAWTDLREHMNTGCPAANVGKVRDYCHYLDERKRRCDQALSQAEIELNQAFQKMLVARQDREAVEQYMAGQQERHDRALLAEERKIIEDIVQRRSSIAISWKPAPNKQWN